MNYHIGYYLSNELTESKRQKTVLIQKVMYHFVSVVIIEEWRYELSVSMISCL